MHQLPNRKHPHRLSEDIYKSQRSPIFVTIAVKRGEHLPIAQLAPTVAQVLHERAIRFGLRLHAYCLMPDHVHFVCSVKICRSSFESFIATFKSEVSRRAHRLGAISFAWERSYWDRHAREEDDVRAMIQYVLDNPVRKGLCENWQDWPWSEYLGWP